MFFAVIAVFLAINSLNNARLVGRLGVVRLVRLQAGIGLGVAAVFAGVSLLHGGRPNFWVFTVGLCALLPFVQGLSPNSNRLAMGPLPHVAGTASSIIATVTSAGGAVLGAIAAAAFDGTVRPFALFILVYVGLAAAFVLWGTA